MLVKSKKNKKCNFYGFFGLNTNTAESNFSCRKNTRFFDIILAFTSHPGP